MKNFLEDQIDAVERIEYMFWGSYPQDKVVDTSIIEELTKLVGEKPSVKAFNGFTSYEYYYGLEVDDDVIPSKDMDYMWYKDITYNNKLYRCVYFNQYRPSRTINKFNDECESSFIKDNYYFFEFKPIKWKVITKFDDNIILISDQILDAQCFNIVSNLKVADEIHNYPNIYSNSFIRRWLNCIFFNAAFSFDEIEKIKCVEIDNSRQTTRSKYGDYYCSNTYDKVWLLSYEEAYKSFHLTNEDRIKTSTDYAVCLGVTNDKWWLRSACPDADNLVSVATEDGKDIIPFICESKYFDDEYNHFGIVDSTTNGVVPVICLKSSEDKNDEDKRFSIKFYDNKGKRLYLEPFYYQKGDSINLPSLNKEDFVFVGWYDGKNIINAITKDMEGDLELKPRYEKTQKVIDYINNNKMYRRKGNSIYFGSYPKSLVTNWNLIKKLKIAVRSRKDDFISYKYYIKSKPSDYMSYLDIEYEGKKYRCVIFSKFRIENIDEDDDYDTIDTHQFVREGKMDPYFLDANRYYFYKFEPIKWNVIEETNDSLTIMSDLVLDSQDYNHFSYLDENNVVVISNNYEKSSIRHWLNDEFYNNAFNEYEQEILNILEIDNSDLSTGKENNAFACSNTFDKVWLLSYKEAASDMYKSFINKSNKVSDYALIQGLYWFENDNGCNILLRSPNDIDIEKCLIAFNEKTFDPCGVKWTDNGIVPVINIRRLNYNK